MSPITGQNVSVESGRKGQNTDSGMTNMRKEPSHDTVIDTPIWPHYPPSQASWNNGNLSYAMRRWLNEPDDRTKFASGSSNDDNRINTVPVSPQRAGADTATPTGDLSHIGAWLRDIKLVSSRFLQPGCKLNAKAESIPEKAVNWPRNSQMATSPGKIMTKCFKVWRLYRCTKARDL